MFGFRLGFCFGFCITLCFGIRLGNIFSLCVGLGMCLDLDPGFGFGLGFNLSFCIGLGLGFNLSFCIGLGLGLGFNLISFCIGLGLATLGATLGVTLGLGLGCRLCRDTRFGFCVGISLCTSLWLWRGFRFSPGFLRRLDPLGLGECDVPRSVRRGVNIGLWRGDRDGRLPRLLRAGGSRGGHA